MTVITRALRAELLRTANDIRQRGQRAGWVVERIAGAICDELPQLLPLEAWRLAYGWSRPQTIAGIQALFEDENLVAPPVNSSMLCRWEHGVHPPGPEYGPMLCRLYGVTPETLGLPRSSAAIPPRRPGAGYRASHWRRPMTEDQYAALSALRESVELALEVDGPAGGPAARQALQAAVEYYALRYSAFPPAVLATEVHRTRALVGPMLRRPQADADRIELRRLAAWLSALVGNTAFHTADHAAASIHFGTAARLGTAVGDHDLICWTLGAQSMTACSQGKPQQAVELAAEALEYARTPLRRAQIIAWGLLRATAALGPSHRSEAERMMAAAQNEMAADPHGDQPGRFGFDAAELLLHLAESALLIGAQDQAVTHAQASQQHSRHGGAGWAAALIVQARAEAARRQYSYATALAGQVLDAVPAQSLRNTTRVRLRALDQKLLSVGDAGIETRDLHDRIAALPALTTVGHLSDEPNGQ